MTVLDKYKSHPSIVLIKQNVKCDHHFVFTHTTEEQVYKILSNLDVKKSTGYDKLSSRILKVSAMQISSFLTHLINMCIDRCIFPENLKYAEISSIYKKKDRLDQQNYRPISILVILSKVFERIYSLQIETYFSSIFNPLMSAYRKGYGCNDLLLKFTEDFRNALDENMYIGALLMNLS